MDPRVIFLETIGRLLTEIIRARFGEAAVTPCLLLGAGCGDEIETLN